MLGKRKNKKAMGIEDIGMIVYRIIFLAVTAFVFVIFINLLLTPSSFSNNAKIEMLLGRVIYSEAIHHTSSETDRIYTNIIDFDKLSSYKKDNKLEDYLRDEFYHKTRENLLVFNLTVKFINPINNNQVVQSFVSNSDQYKLLEPKKNFEGKGAVTATERIFTTQCLVESKIVPCEIELLLLMPNS